MLAIQPFAMPWPQSSTRRIVEREFAAKGLRDRMLLEAGGWEVVKRYASLEAGMAIVPACCVRRKDRTEIGTRSVTSAPSYGRRDSGKASRGRNEGGDGKRPELLLVISSNLAVVRVSRRVRPLPEIRHSLTVALARVLRPISLPAPIEPRAPAESDRQ